MRRHSELSQLFIPCSVQRCLVGHYLLPQRITTLMIGFSHNGIKGRDERVLHRMFGKCVLATINAPQRSCGGYFRYPLPIWCFCSRSGYPPVIMMEATEHWEGTHVKRQELLPVALPNGFEFASGSGIRCAMP